MIQDLRVFTPAPLTKHDNTWLIPKMTSWEVTFFSLTIASLDRIQQIGTSGRIVTQRLCDSTACFK